MAKKARRLICVIGGDGSGKTTLCEATVDRLASDNIRAQRIWLGAESYLMFPIRWCLRIMRGRSNGSVTHGYNADAAMKSKLVARFRYLVPIYIALVMIDYKLQMLIKLGGAARSDVIFADRYIFDVAVNLGLTLGWDEAEVVEFLHRRLGSVVMPDIAIYLHVPTEVAISRKDDIPHPDYLRRRKSYYDAIAGAFGFAVLDGTGARSKNVEILRSMWIESRSMRHVHYVHSNNSDLGGADFVLQRMASKVQGDPGKSKKWRTSVSLRLPTRIVKEYEKIGIPVYIGMFVRPQLSRGLHYTILQMVMWPVTLLYFIRLFWRIHPDIVHVNDVYDFLPALAARIVGIPVVYHVRMIRGRQWERRLFARVITVTSRISVHVSQAVRECYFPGGTAAGNHRAVTIYDHANEQLMAEEQRKMNPPDGLSGRRRNVVMVGRIEPWKGQEVFLEAVGKLDRRSETNFLLVGGPVRGKECYFRNIVEQAGRVGVVCLGERLDIPDILRWSDISVHASVLPDPLPGVVIESLLAGTATIAAAAGGVPELISDGVTGRLFTPGDSNDLSSILSKVLGSPLSPRNSYGDAGRATALSMLEPGRITSKLCELYSFLVWPSVCV